MVRETKYGRVYTLFHIRYKVRLWYLFPVKHKTLTQEILLKMFLVLFLFFNLCIWIRIHMELDLYLEPDPHYNACVSEALIYTIIFLYKKKVSLYNIESGRTILQLCHPRSW